MHRIQKLGQYGIHVLTYGTEEYCSLCWLLLRTDFL